MCVLETSIPDPQWLRQVLQSCSKRRKGATPWLKPDKLWVISKNVFFQLSQTFLWRSHSHLHIKVVKTIPEIGTPVLLKTKLMPFHCIWLIFSSSFSIFSCCTGFTVLRLWNCAAVCFKTLVLLWRWKIPFSLFSFLTSCLSSCFSPFQFDNYRKTKQKQHKTTTKKTLKSNEAMISVKKE